MSSEKNRIELGAVQLLALAAIESELRAINGSGGFWGFLDINITDLPEQQVFDPQFSGLSSEDDGKRNQKLVKIEGLWVRRDNGGLITTLKFGQRGGRLTATCLVQHSIGNSSFDQVLKIEITCKNGDFHLVREWQSMDIRDRDRHEHGR